MDPCGQVDLISNRKFEQLNARQLTEEFARRKSY